MENIQVLPFMAVAMRTGQGFHINMPKKIIDSLGVKDRDELVVEIRKTGNSVPKTNRFFNNMKNDLAEEAKEIY